jgi:hypothetical protein
MYFVLHSVLPLHSKHTDNDKQSKTHRSRKF